MQHLLSELSATTHMPMKVTNGTNAAAVKSHNDCCVAKSAHFY